MLAFSFYLLKVIICSAILYGYYLLALRNKIFHRYNRFYLLASVILAITLPLIEINIWHNINEPANQGIKLLQVVTNSNEYLDEVIIYVKRNNFSAEQGLLLFYLLTSLVFAWVLVRSLIKIYWLFKKNEHRFIENIFFVNTTAKGTPFSFFRYIFWNDLIDPESTTGHQVFKHELAHVRQKHSYDKVFMQVVLIVFWCNPFFWLIRKELGIIHEFMADKIAVEDSNTETFAEMILQAAYPQHRFQLTNPFFYSSIKRRLMMLTKNKNSKVGYIGRLLVLPLSIFIFAAFTIKTKSAVDNTASYNGRKFVVVIDAGHGGDDKGAYATPANIFEKDLNLDIVKKIKELNNNINIQLVFTRLTDITQTVQQKVDLTKSANADLYISIHIGASPPNAANPYSGLQVYLASKNQEGAEKSRTLASAIINEFSSNYDLPVRQNPEQRNVGVRVLDAATCPAVLIEAGNISNKKDFAYLQQASAKKIIAENILAAINKYAIVLEKTSTKTSGPSTVNVISVKDTLPQVEIKYAENALIIVDGKTMSYNQFKKIKPDDIAAIDVLKSDESLKKYGVKGKNGVVLVTTKTVFIELHDVNISLKDKDDSVTNGTASIKFNGRTSDLGELSKVLFIVNGKIQNSVFDLKTIQANDIQSISVLKDKSATEKYGAKAINGAIEITTKKTGKEITSDFLKSTDEKIFTKVENEPSFPGGDSAWIRYLQKHINVNTPVDEGWAAGHHKIIVQFIVHQDGSITDIKTDDYPNSKTAQQCIDLIAKGPKWIPARQNDRIVTAYRKQPITFVIEEN